MNRLYQYVDKLVSSSNIPEDKVHDFKSEITQHLIDLYEDFRSNNIPHDEAIDNAINQFGDINKLASSLRTSNSIFTDGQRKILMGISILLLFLSWVLNSFNGYQILYSLIALVPLTILFSPFIYSGKQLLITIVAAIMLLRPLIMDSMDFYGVDIIAAILTGILVFIVSRSLFQTMLPSLIAFGVLIWYEYISFIIINNEGVVRAQTWYECFESARDLILLGLPLTFSSFIPVFIYIHTCRFLKRTKDVLTTD